MGSIFDRIAQRRSDLSNSYKKVADYLEQNYEDAAFMSALQIAQGAGVSESVVIRFSRILNYSGFPEMKRYLEAEVKKNMTMPQKMRKADVGENISSTDIYRVVMTQEYNNILGTMKNPYNLNSLEQVVDALETAETIYIVAVRVLEYMAQILESLLGAIGKRVICINPEKAMDMHRLVHAGDRDAAILISFARYDKRMVRASRYLRQNGVKIVTLADSQESPDTRDADLVIYLQVDSHSHTNSYCALSAVMNALVTALGSRDRERTLANLDLVEDLSGIKEFTES